MHTTWWKHRDMAMAMREAGRYFLAALALLMLFQVVNLVLKLQETMTKTHWSDDTILALVAGYIGWISVTIIGGVCGLYSSAFYDIPTATWCLRSWWLHLFFQIVEGFLLFNVLCETKCADAITHAYGWNTLVLIGTQGLFLTYIYLYMHILQVCVEAEGKTSILLEAKLKRNEYGTYLRTAIAHV